MSITVVATRDDSGAPTCREVYAAGARYTIDNANLQVYTAELRILALYPSGSWTSVYVDDTARVLGETGAASSKAVPPAVEAATSHGDVALDDDDELAADDIEAAPALHVVQNDAPGEPDALPRGMRRVVFGPWTGGATQQPGEVPAPEGARSRIRPVVFGPWTRGK